MNAKPGWMIAIASWLVAAAAPWLGDLGIFQSNPDMLETVLNILQTGLLALGGAVIGFYSDSSAWEKINRLASAVWQVVETEGQAGVPNTQLRERAVDQFLTLIPQAKLGWLHRVILAIPGIRGMIAGMIFDRISSANRRLVANVTERKASRGLLRETVIANKV